MSVPDLFFVEPSGVFRRALRALVAAEAPETRILGEAESGGEALEALEDLAPCVVLLSRRLPDRSGFEVLEAIEDRRPDLPVLMVAVDWDEVDLRAALDRGASGVLLKQDVADRLVQALRGIVDSGRYVPEEWSGRFPAGGGGRPRGGDAR